jgi:DNA-directed RNA polymerase subunit RPC12/RpoP
MDVIFNCPKCDQELAVDSSGSGSQIDCPACGESIVIPEATAAPKLAPSPGGPVASPAGHQSGSAMHSSAAAKVEMHLKVPSHTSVESLIAKPLAPLEVAAKEKDKKIRVKTIRHTDCIEVGKDKFDDVLTEFLGKVGESNVININPMTYTHLDIGSQKLMTEYAVLIVYRG